MSYKNLSIDPLFNAQGKRPSCMFNDNQTTYYRDMGKYICEHHLYQDIQQTFILHGYSLTLEQVYLDANQLLIATRVISSDGRGKLHSIPATGLKVTLQDKNQNTLSSTSDGIFDKGRNTTIWITASLFNPPIAPGVFNSVQNISLTLQINHLDVLRTTWGTLLGNKEQPIIFHLTLPFYAGRTYAIQQTITLGKEHLTLEKITVMPSMLHILLKTPQSTPSFAFSMKNAILSQPGYQLSNTRTEALQERTTSLYFHNALMDKKGRWALTIPLIVAPYTPALFYFVL